MGIEELIEQGGFRVVARAGISERTAKYKPVPEKLHQKVKNILTQQYPSGLYSHQSEAIESVLSGNDICLATSTASGKSLVFMAIAADILARHEHGRIVVFYPVRALIQDQLQKWTKLIEPLGCRPGFIDGSVPTSERLEILFRHRVILMTPDVAHAWFMSHLAEPAVKVFRDNLHLLILDEAHVYEGVFGTNMAFFLRRFQAVTGDHRMICSTATLGAPTDFVYQLTGRKAVQFGPESDGASAPSKQLLLTRLSLGDEFDATAKLLGLLGPIDI